MRSLSCYNRVTLQDYGNTGCIFRLIVGSASCLSHSAHTLGDPALRTACRALIEAGVRLTLCMMTGRGLLSTWPLPLVRDQRYFTWHSDEEVRTRG